MKRILIEFLKGKWLGHPLHPVMAHVPTALFPAAVIFDLLSRAGNGNDAFVRTSFWCILIGLIAVLAAVPTGLVDWSEVKRGKPAWRIGLIHMILNIVVALLFLVNLILRWNDPPGTARVADLPLILSAVGTGVLLVSGWLGGRMVFHYGVSVARMSKDKWKTIATEGGARMPTEEGN